MLNKGAYQFILYFTHLARMVLRNLLLSLHSKGVTRYQDMQGSFVIVRNQMMKCLELTLHFTKLTSHNVCLDDVNYVRANPFLILEGGRTGSVKSP